MIGRPDNEPSSSARKKPSSSTPKIPEDGVIVVTVNFQSNLRNYAQSKKDEFQIVDSGVESDLPVALKEMIIEIAKTLNHIYSCGCYFNSLQLSEMLIISTEPDHVILKLGKNIKKDHQGLNLGEDPRRLLANIISQFFQVADRSMCIGVREFTRVLELNADEEKLQWKDWCIPDEFLEHSLFKDLEHKLYFLREVNSERHDLRKDQSVAAIPFSWPTDPTLQGMKNDNEMWTSITYDITLLDFNYFVRTLIVHFDDVHPYYQAKVGGSREISGVRGQESPGFLDENRICAAAETCTNNQSLLKGENRVDVPLKLGEPKTDTFNNSPIMYVDAKFGNTDIAAHLSNWTAKENAKFKNLFQNLKTYNDRNVLVVHVIGMVDRPDESAPKILEDGVIVVTENFQSNLRNYAQSNC